MEKQYTNKKKSDQDHDEPLGRQNFTGAQIESVNEIRHGNEYRIKIFIASAEGKIRYFI
jgi:hypothetical protein